MAKNAEAALQASIVQYVRTVAPHILIFHVPNGEWRDKRTAAKLKWMGLVPGIPDLCLIRPASLGVGFWEVKTERGKFTEAQKEIAKWCNTSAVPYWSVRSIDDARIALEEWGVVTREVAA